MEKRKIYLTSSIIIMCIIFILYLYFIPFNFLKFITWLGNNEPEISLNIGTIV